MVGEEWEAMEIRELERGCWIAQGNLNDGAKGYFHRRKRGSGKDGKMFGGTEAILHK